MQLNNMVLDSKPLPAAEGKTEVGEDTREGISGKSLSGFDYRIT